MESPSNGDVEGMKSPGVELDKGSHGLIHRKQQQVEHRDFVTEVRGMKDVEGLLDNCSILLDVQERPNENPATSSLETLIDELLQDMVTGEGASRQREELKSLIFSNAERSCFSETVQGSSEDGGVDQAWLCSATSVPTLTERKVGMVRMARPTNMGGGALEVTLFLLVLAPETIKGTKSALETARTFATLLCQPSLRRHLHDALSVEEFRQQIKKAATEEGGRKEKKEVALTKEGDNDELKFWQAGAGIRQDLARRIPFYWSDYKDGVVGPKSLQKTLSTTFFLYFSIILPAIAFGNLQDDNTGGAINVEKILVGQVFGGLIFAVLAGQPLVVVMTTAPLVLFTKIILGVAKAFGFPFLPFFGMVGIWNSIFLIFYGVFNLSKLMKFSSRSTEETFGNFISIALTVDALKHLVASYNANYNNKACMALTGVVEDEHMHSEHEHELTNPLAEALNRTRRAAVEEDLPCQREVFLLYLILMLGTVWFGVSLFNFIQTPYLSPRKRELLSDYALPVAVVVFSLIGSGIFSDVALKPFNFKGEFIIEPVAFNELTVGAVFFAALLGFSLSILFFMDQNISAAMVNSPENHLKKGNAYHWDLVVVALINAVLSVFGLPFMHAVLPHSPLHVQCLADKETRVEGGYARDVVTYVRETRLTNIFSNILIGLSMLFLKYLLPFVPKAVLDGLFLYMAVTALYGNQMFERVSLLVTEQSAYPPNHYIKRVPQRKMHIFTGCQLVQLLVLCVFGFTPWPYIKMIFPVVLALFLPVRHLVLPKLLEKKYLASLDPLRF